MVNKCFLKIISHFALEDFSPHLIELFCYLMELFYRRNLTL